MSHRGHGAQNLENRSYNCGRNRESNSCPYQYDIFFLFSVSRVTVSLGRYLPSMRPRRQWLVVPPLNWEAAIPVVAVTATIFRCSTSFLHNVPRSVLLPVPAWDCTSLHCGRQCYPAHGIVQVLVWAEEEGSLGNSDTPLHSSSTPYATYHTMSVGRCFYTGV